MQTRSVSQEVVERRAEGEGRQESEFPGLIGAERYERSRERNSYRSGCYRLRSRDTRVRTIELAIPKIRTRSSFPSLLEPRRRAERAPQAMVQEAYVHGGSTSRVDDVLNTLGLDGMSKSEVLRICIERDGELEAFRPRPITGDPYVWRDPTTRCARDGRARATATIPHSAREPVAAIARTVFAQPDRATAMAQLHSTMVLTRFRRQARYAATVAAACCRSKSIGLT